MLAFALSSTDSPCESVHNLVFISVFRFDFGAFFLFITVERVWYGGLPSWNSFFFFFLGTGELSTLRQMMKAPNQSGLSANNGLENAFLSNPRKGQAKRFGVMTTSHDGKAGHVMTHVCRRASQEQRQV